MRRSLIAAATLVGALAFAQPALAWDPFAYETAPTPAPSDPDAFVVPDGLYAVTDVYAGDVVTTSGSTTTYATTTTHETPGTYARVVAVVGTGQASAYDGSSMNGRASLPDGRLVAGTYYEDFIVTADGFISVNIVFFQDDSVTWVSAPAPTVAPTPTPSAATTPGSAATPRAEPTPGAFPAPTAFPGATPAPPPSPTAAPASRIATAGIALGPNAPVLASVEVLRGRRVALWPRVFVDGAPVPVRTWRLASGYVDLAWPTAGGPGTSCDATWLVLPPAGSAWTLRFEVTSDAMPGRTLIANIDVLVRSPALGQ